MLALALVCVIAVLMVAGLWSVLLVQRRWNFWLSVRDDPLNSGDAVAIQHAADKMDTWSLTASWLFFGGVLLALGALVTVAIVAIYAALIS